MLVSNLQKRIILTAIVFLTAALLLNRLTALAEPQTVAEDDGHLLLEKSLSIIEIDKEIIRIQQQKQQLTRQLSQSEKQLLEQEQQIVAKKEEAGSILRAYYMGERNFLFAALLSFDSLSELFRMIDYAELILSNDKQILNTYKDAYKKVKEGYQELETRQAELTLVEQQLHTQRERIVLLEKQLEDQLNGRSDEDRMRLLIQELTSSWETAGLDEVKQYFRALSKAMQKLPSWIQDNKQLLEINGFKYTIHIPEEKLNAFLREENAIFENFSFQFIDNKVIAQGQRDHMDIKVSGHYTVENEPANSILFHVDELLFNGFALPDTTRKSLEEEFDLGFYPNLIISFIKANEVQIIDGELIIKLSVNL